jgi:hypothetical protein
VNPLNPAPTLLGETASWLLWPDDRIFAAGAPDFVFHGPPSTPPPDIIDVNRPRVFYFAPDHSDGRAALVLAGGGYTKLVASYEGVDVARWLNSLGIHAFLLIHRFPNERWAIDGRSGSQAPVDDAIECMRQVRARAQELGIASDRLGVLGLSSGGHLAACLASRYPPAWSPPPSNYPRVSHRPDFMIVGYAPISTNATGRTVISNKPPLPPPEKQALYEALQPDAHLLDDPPPTLSRVQRRGSGGSRRQCLAPGPGAPSPGRQRRMPRLRSRRARIRTAREGSSRGGLARGLRGVVAHRLTPQVGLRRFSDPAGVVRVSRMSDTRSEILWYLMVEVVMFTFVAMAHGGILLTGHEHAQAAVGETVIAVLLGAALLMGFVSPGSTRTIAMLTQGLALVGLIAGFIAIAIDVMPRSVANIAVYAIMTLTVVFGLLVAKRGVTT